MKKTHSDVDFKINPHLMHVDHNLLYLDVADCILKITNVKHTLQSVLIIIQKAQSHIN